MGLRLLRYSIVELLCTLKRLAVRFHVHAFWRPPHAETKGRPTTRKSVPDIKAPQRHPHWLTATASSGAMMAPPTGTAALTTVIARARKRMNQVLATISGRMNETRGKRNGDDSQIDDKKGGVAVDPREKYVADPGE